MEETLKLLGRNIRELRKQANYTQSMLAEKAGICPKFIGQLERGESNPSITVLHKIACALSKDVSRLLITNAASSGKAVHIDRIVTLLMDRKESELLDIAKALELLLRR